ncbi:SpoIVB peptidase [Gemmiger sp.]
MHGRKFLRRGLAVLALAALLGAAMLTGLSAALPDTLYTDGPAAELRVASMPYLSARKTQGSVPADSAATDKSANVTLALFGVVPVKTVRAVSAQRRTVQLCGTPFGVKLFSDGALVVAFSDRYTALGSENPAKAAGLRLGDLIVSANGHSVRSNEDLSQAIQAANGAPLTVVYKRGGAQYTAQLTPAADGNGGYKAGVWVRDSGAGIGTMSFTDPLHGTFAGLGHSISDTDTGTDLTLLSGEIVPVTVTGCIRGAAGSLGELRGEFSATAAGQVLANDTAGVYGSYSGPQSGHSVEVANLQEVTPGDAELWTTVQGTAAKPYKVKIERVTMTGSDPNRNMLIHVTDESLLETTGGIVQGMSGSPIVQNGRMAAVLTHVLVNDPTRGYAIFASTMLEKADAVAPQN